MTKKFDKSSLIEVALLFLIGCVGIWGAIFSWNNVQYHGKFNATHEQYEQFKSLAINPNYNIERLQIMNSEPVYIDFTMWVPANTAFPFGERNEFLRIVLASFSSLMAVSSPFLIWKWLRDFGWETIELKS
jgi:hypothetical protein